MIKGKEWLDGSIPPQGGMIPHGGITVRGRAKILQLTAKMLLEINGLLRAPSATPTMLLKVRSRP